MLSEAFRLQISSIILATPQNFSKNAVIKTMPLEKCRMHFFPASTLLTSFKSTKPAAIGLLVIAILAVLSDIAINRMLSQQHSLDQHLVTTLTLSTFRARIEQQINTNLLVLNGLATDIAVHHKIDQEKFEPLAAEMLKQHPTLKNIVAAPDFVVRFVYPHAGNEKVLGLDYRKHPTQWDAARRAYETKQMVVAGPVELAQGGRGVIARVPVFFAGSDQFWGLVSAVVDIEKLLTTALLDPVAPYLKIAIRGTDGTGPEGDVFWGDAELFSEQQQAITMPITLPYGSWQVAAIPNGGWSAMHPRAWLVHLMTTVAATAIGMVLIQRVRSRKELIESETRMRAMSQASHDALVMIDAEDTVTFWNPAAEKMFGYTEQDMLGKKLHDYIVQPHDRIAALQGLKYFSKSGQGRVLNMSMEMDGVRKSGEIFPVERSVASFKIHDTWYAVGSIRDISVRKEYEHKLHELATTDELTGLNNRRHLIDQAIQQFKLSKRYSKNLCFLILDIDHFKNVNDTYGHDAGDIVLQSASHLFSSSLRNVDIFGRMGGEEFAAVMPETSIATARLAGERLRQKFESTSIVLQDAEIRVTVSIGISHVQNDTATLADLYKAADTMLYKAKNSGRNRVVTDDDESS